MYNVEYYDPQSAANGDAFKPYAYTITKLIDYLRRTSAQDGQEDNSWPR